MDQIKRLSHSMHDMETSTNVQSPHGYRWKRTMIISNQLDALGVIGSPIARAYATHGNLTSSMTHMG